MAPARVRCSRKSQIVFASGTRSCRAGPKGAHEGQAVLDLEFGGLIGQGMQGLEHQDLEHQRRVVRRSPTPRSVRPRKGLDQRGSEHLEVDQGRKADQRVTALGQRPIALVEIKETRLPRHIRPRRSTSRSESSIQSKEEGFSRCPLGADWLLPIHPLLPPHSEVRVPMD
jgi:hypothetical protein